MVCQDLYPNKELGKEFYDHAMQVHEALVDYILWHVYISVHFIEYLFLYLLSVLLPLPFECVPAFSW